MKIAAMGTGRRGGAVDLGGLPALIDGFAVPMFALEVLSEAPLRVRFAAINAAQAAASGFGPEHLVGLDPEEALGHRAAAQVMESYARCIAARATIAYEEAMECPDGAARWFDTTLTPWADETGRIRALVGTALETTALVERARGAERRVGEIGLLADEIRLFSAMAAHDVRGPLATIESLAEMVSNGFVDLGDGKLRMLDGCITTAREARAQMDELLRHADALGRPGEPPERVELPSLLSRIATLVDPDGRIRFDWPAASVTAEQAALKLVLRNLMGNAVRFCEGRVSIRLGRAPSGQIALTVADDGPGLPDGVDPFAPDEEARVRTAHGYGLPAVKTLIGMRGGTVRAGRDETGLGGAAVSFTIPGERLAAA